ncbi:MAG: copper oxidase [Spirochaetia bacterium]|nr:copper oxidase [Spirochaetia bacterium]
MTREDFIKASGLAFIGGIVSRSLFAQEHQHSVQPVLPAKNQEPAKLPERANARPEPLSGRAGAPYTPVISPNVAKLPYKMDGAVKVFHLIAEPVMREFTPGMLVDCWGYNGSTPGPVIEAVEGDRVRIYVTNRLPEPTSVHWHGIFLPSGMDGVAGLNQKHIQPGETYKYEFTLRQHGSHMYHPHSDEVVQMALGMMGMFIIHPKQPVRKIDRHFVYMLSEWAIEPGTSRPNPNVMTDFNIFSLNGRIYPGTDPMVVRTNQRVRITLGNLSMDSHPIHVHGHAFRITGTDGGPIPETAWVPETTVNVPPGTTRDVEFIADAPGDWAFHCHKSHHTMNAMGHQIPNVVGMPDNVDLHKKIQSAIPGYMEMGKDGMHDMATMRMPGPANTAPMMAGEGPHGPIGMGGMFTVLKVRDGITKYNDPGWYNAPAGTIAQVVKESEIK